MFECRTVLVYTDETQQYSKSAVTTALIVVPTISALPTADYLHQVSLAHQKL